VNTPTAPEANALPALHHESDGWWTRDRALVLVLAAVTVLLVWLCYRMAQPFLPAIAWAVALAVVAHPLHGWLEARLARPGLAAGVGVALAAVAIIGPMAWLGQQVGKEVGRTMQQMESGEAQKGWDEIVRKVPQLGPAQQWLQEQTKEGQGLQNSLTSARKVVKGSVGLVIQLLATLFFLFFLFRDRRKALRTVRSMVPLSERETDDVLKRVADTIHASIYGTLTVAAVQGALGGLMFWWLGLPAPLLWGIVMALLAVVPVLGAFVIWVPAALFLAVSGQWGKAMILTAWGTVVIGLADNLLYPVLVGDRLRLHTAAVFVAIVGGLDLFGGCGIVLGPVALALTLALVEIWRRRTRGGRPAEEAVAPVAATPARSGA
jgi:predicted PurR-regulated permease PerM